MTRDSAVWVVQPPAKWPGAPDRFSYSSIHDVEACPRRWALENAEYPGLDGRYPTTVATAALAGTAIHETLETIVTALRDRDVSSPEETTDVLRELGGISAELGRRIEAIHDSLLANPRARHRADDVVAALQRRAPDMRAVVQSALARVFSSAAPTRNDVGTASGGPALRDGFYTEVKLAPEGLPWFGWADAIRIDPDSVEIIDYKSGEASESHFEQLRIYAALWFEDGARNPAGRRADSLRLIYPGGTREYEGPTIAQLRDLHDTLVRRAADARVALTSVPPDARVSPAACSYCDVRQLCADYWTPQGQQHMAEPTPPLARAIEVTISGRRGDRVWDIIVDRDPYLPAGTKCVGVLDSQVQLEVGNRVRLLGVRVSEGDLEQYSITTASWSEVFVLS